MAKLVNTKCLNCNAQTNQKVLFSKIEIQNAETDNHDENVSTLELQEYMIVQCAGCNTISFLQRMTLKDDQDKNEKSFSVDINYPEADYHSYNFLNDEEQKILPKMLRNLYDEIIAAFENDSEILAGLGLRTLVEAICIEQKVAGDNLQKKIINLKVQGLISANEVPILDKLRIIGNFAAHQLKGLPLDILSYALDIVNHVLKSIYILPRINKKINIK